jgi:hypothetical protein
VLLVLLLATAAAAALAAAVLLAIEVRRPAVPLLELSVELATEDVDTGWADPEKYCDCCFDANFASPEGRGTYCVPGVRQRARAVG